MSTVAQASEVLFSFRSMALKTAELRPAGKFAALSLYAVAAPPLGLAGLLFLTTQIDPAWIPSDPTLQFGLILGLGGFLVSIAILPSIGYAAFVGYLYGSSASAYALTAVGIGVATYVGLKLAKSLSRDAAKELLGSHPRGQKLLAQVNGASSQSLLGFVGMARLSPHMPFALTNILVAQFERPLYQLVLCSWLGLMPRSLIAVGLGGSLASLDSWADVKALGWWACLATALVIVYGGRLAYRALHSSKV